MSTLWGFLDPAEHAHMLLDPIRVDAYASAIAAVVRPGDVVVDIGTGTGILAILAARAGARRVFAVERTGIAELARRHVADNGLDGVVEVIRADLADVEALPERPRVILGEILGNFAPVEGQHRAYAAARRLATDDAVSIPSRYRLTYGALRATGLRDDLAALASVHGVRLDGLRERLRSRPAFVHADPAELLGPEIEGPWIAAEAPPPRELSAAIEIAHDGAVGAIGVGFVAELAPGQVLRTAITAPRTCWSQTVFPIDPPLPVRAGATVAVSIWPRIVTNASTWAWRAACDGDAREGDAMDADIGGDLWAQLRARPVGKVTGEPTPLLRAWAAALGVPLDTVDVDALARRAMIAFPARYPNLEEARQDVIALIVAATR